LVTCLAIRYTTQFGVIYSAASQAGVAATPGEEIERTVIFSCHANNQGEISSLYSLQELSFKIWTPFAFKNSLLYSTLNPKVN